MCCSHVVLFSRFVSVQVVHPYNGTHTVTTWKKSRFLFIREIRFPFERQPVKSNQRLPDTYVDIDFCRWDITAEVWKLVYEFQRLNVCVYVWVCVSVIELAYYLWISTIILQGTDHNIYIYIYIYIYSHPQTACFVVSQLFSVARYVGCLKLGSKPVQLYVRLSIIPLSQQANHVSSGILSSCLRFV